MGKKVKEIAKIPKCCAKLATRLKIADKTERRLSQEVISLKIAQYFLKASLNEARKNYEAYLHVTPTLTALLTYWGDATKTFVIKSINWTTCAVIGRP